MTNKPEYTRYLPHYHHIGATFFVTYRLDGSLPKSFLDSLSLWYHAELNKIEAQVPSSEKGSAIYMLQRDYFRKFDAALDQCLCGPTFLKDPAAANKAIEQLTRFDGEFYHLKGYTIMPNHVHALMDFSVQLDPKDGTSKDDYKNLDYVMNRIKGASSRYINMVLDRTGKACWQREYHDRYIRDHRHLLASVDYLKQNVVSARICKHWKEHPFTWVSEEFW